MKVTIWVCTVTNTFVSELFLQLSDFQHADEQTYTNWNENEGLSCVCVCRPDQRSDDRVPGEAPSAARGVDAPRAGGADQHSQQDRGRGERICGSPAPPNVPEISSESLRSHLKHHTDAVNPSRHALTVSGRLELSRTFHVSVEDVCCLNFIVIQSSFENLRQTSSTPAGCPVTWVWEHLTELSPEHCNAVWRDGLRRFLRLIQPPVPHSFHQYLLRCVQSKTICLCQLSVLCVLMLNWNKFRLRQRENIFKESLWGICQRTDWSYGGTQADKESWVNVSVTFIEQIFVKCCIQRVHWVILSHST